MSKLKILSVLISGVCACGINVTNADDFVSFSQLVGDFDAGTAGLEIAMPNIKNFDLNPVDGYPESFGLKYDVYTSGTKTLLYSTAWRYFNRPALPVGCTVSSNFDTEFSPKFLRRSDSTRMHMAIVTYLGCFDGAQWIYKDNSAIYSADVKAVSPGATWAYKLDGYYMDGVDGIDTNNDGLTDTLLVSHTYDTPMGGANAYVLGLNPGTGAISIPAVTYPLLR